LGPLSRDHPQGKKNKKKNAAQTVFLSTTIEVFDHKLGEKIQR